MPKKKVVENSGIKVKLRIFSIIFVLFSLAVLLLTLSPLLIDDVQSKVILVGDQLKVESSNQVQVREVVVPKETKIEVLNKGLKEPEFSAKAVIAEDLTTGKILFQKNMNLRLPIASTTKIMTALVSSLYFKSAQILTVPSSAIVSGSSMGLVPGENLSFRSLLYGMLLNSGNDAAYTIAESYPGGLDSFVEAMNKKAQELGLTNTHFTNPAGFDDPNHYSSAYDLAKIGSLSIDSPQLAKVVSTKETFVYSWDKTRTHLLKNLNKLLNEVGVLGIKTGTTEAAGESLVGLVDRDNHKVVTVMLSSGDRFGETKTLMDWIYQNYSWREVALNN